jgi:hypothetical protein
MINNFLIVGTQRTGSTALTRALTFHPDIACGGEWTQFIPAHRKLAVTEQALSGDFSALSENLRSRIEQLFNANTRWLGFKVLFRSSALWLVHPRCAPALWFDRVDAHLRWLAERPNIHVIHIVRKDPIEWLKSKYLADKTRAFAARGYPEGITVKIPIREAVRRLATKRWIDERLSRINESNPYLCVSYEEFLASDRMVVLKLLDFLKCDPAKLREFDYRKLRKQSKRSTRDYITNYDEVVVALRNSQLLAR